MEGENRNKYAIFRSSFRSVGIIENITFLIFLSPINFITMPMFHVSWILLMDVSFIDNY